VNTPDHHLSSHSRETLKWFWFKFCFFDLLGLSQTELLNYNNKPFLPSVDWLEHADISQASTQSLTQVYKQIWYGSFSKINLEHKEQIRNRFYSSYVQTCLQRDVKDILKISNDALFSLFRISGRFSCLIYYLNRFGSDSIIAIKLR
jgi:hypothetical protein